MHALNLIAAFHWTFVCFLTWIKNSEAQYYGSNFLGALRGYGTDTCRFVSCPLGQVCINGICQTSAAAGLYSGGLGGLGAFGGALSGYGTGLGSYGSYGSAGSYGLGGLYGAANKLCAETVDCYSGQTCQAGRCTFASGVGGYYGSGLGLGSLGGLGMGLGTGSIMDTTGVSSLYSPYSSIYSPYSSYGSLGTLMDRPSGIQMCTLMQDCANGQICVNGFCSQSNVVYGGSQAFKPPISCYTGAVCPVGHYCMGGICAQSYLSSTTPCSAGAFCPAGMSCYMGRCSPNPSSSLLYGKKRK